MQKILENIHNAIDRIIGDIIRPLVLKTKEWMRIRREGKTGLWKKILNIKVQEELVVLPPNILSLLRPFLVWIVTVMMTYQIPLFYLFLLTLIALITDKFDGAWAQIDGKTAFGAFIDPVCDKISFIIFVSHSFEKLTFWVAIVAITIDVLLFIVALVGFILQGTKKKENVRFGSNAFGKAKFFIQAAGMIAICLYLFPLANYILIISIPFAILSFFLKVYILAKP